MNNDLDSVLADAALFLAEEGMRSMSAAVTLARLRLSSSPTDQTIPVERILADDAECDVGAPISVVMLKVG